MAIQVNGTTVIDDSRNLSNVTGLKTINSTSILGSGDIAAGASTTYGDVGTYLLGYEDLERVTENTTIAGSSLFPAGIYGFAGFMSVDGGVGGNFTRGGTALSGTWRRMFRANAGGGDFKIGLHVRIS